MVVFSAAVFGIITVVISFSCQYLGPTVLQISLSIFGLLGGPLLGVISLGMFFPVANAKVSYFYLKLIIGLSS